MSGASQLCDEHRIHAGHDRLDGPSRCADPVGRLDVLAIFFGRPLREASRGSEELFLVPKVELGDIYLR